MQVARMVPPHDKTAYRQRRGPMTRGCGVRGGEGPRISMHHCDHAQVEMIQWSVPERNAHARWDTDTPYLCQTRLCVVSFEVRLALSLEVLILVEHHAGVFMVIHPRLEVHPGAAGEVEACQQAVHFTDVAEHGKGGPWLGLVAAQTLGAEPTVNAVRHRHGLHAPETSLLQQWLEVRKTATWEPQTPAPVVLFAPQDHLRTGRCIHSRVAAHYRLASGFVCLAFSSTYPGFNGGQDVLGHVRDPRGRCPLGGQLRGLSFLIGSLVSLEIFLGPGKLQFQFRHAFPSLRQRSGCLLEGLTSGLTIGLLPFPLGVVTQQLLGETSERVEAGTGRCTVDQRGNTHANEETKRHHHTRSLVCDTCS
mmetsp:Transcript_36306/g.96491  ORF Transcript_36306/g.96491 Transcript_36306/m.96491 type:complete len:363 (+) Transcript_36306:1069-2157(+)